ncbi:type I 3-dehydroquinate dehydratase [Candidatus Micrarchaeota archaeon]|nr:type I 3-dehydroquinate dehydratase [Candidatus Micrarchaeota archaeon]MBU1166299.1 type I 3-dehydroquinate dehydratase [Candidatus Micrarchaeota archaeon]MBU1886391.1 type I 3-dehydroquinate dehydratase [Candidatus Micrarchaeota archaeon]
MICVSIANKTFEECKEISHSMEFAEIRLDTMQLTPEEIKKLFLGHKKLIATCRPGKHNDEQRLMMLSTAIDAGAAFVDIELESEDDYRKMLVKKAHEKECEVIISYHDYDGTLPKEELEEIVSGCFRLGADVAKIACKVKTEKDNARLFGLLDSDRKLVVIGIGEHGKITRIVAPMLGSQFTFAVLKKGEETADGQMTIEEMEKLSRILGGHND